MRDNALEIPEQMAHLPVWKDYPITYTTMVKDGVPDFAVVNEPKRMQCIRSFWCGICGKPLTMKIAFIGGPLSIKNQAFYDPGMHEVCARYAMAVCPFLVHKDSSYKTVEATAKRHKGDDSIRVRPTASEERPEKMGLYICNGYRRVGDQVHAFPPRSVEWFEGI